MSIFEALTLFVVMLPLAAMPSSSVALVVARSASGGRLNGAFSALGIVAGDLIFVAMALVGMSVLAESLGALFAIVKYCAGAYLVWLGWGLLRSKPSLTASTTTKKTTTLMADFLAGLLLTLGDFKAILFYASLFPTLVDMERLGVWDVPIIMAITVVTVGGVKLAYAIFASRIVENLSGRVSSDVPRKLGGTLMIGCG
ncbi:MAG: LysE family translocator, partial [Candidatus Nitrotoga sp.]